MMFITKMKKKMEDGEVFGIIGIMLLLCLVSAYDATGVFQLYRNRLRFLESTNHNETEVYSPSESNELAWQYAWSTKPSCARIHAINQREEEKESRKLSRDQKVDKEGPPTFKVKAPFENYAWFFQGMSKDEIQGGSFPAAANAKGRSGASSFGVTIDRSTSSGRLYEEDCQNTSESKNPVSIRDWMVSMHNRVRITIQLIS